MIREILMYEVVCDTCMTPAGVNDTSGASFSIDPGTSEEYAYNQGFEKIRECDMDATVCFHETEEAEEPWAVVRICPRGEGERALAACYIDGSLSHHRETVINVQLPNKFDMELVLAQSEYVLGPGRHGRKK